jgi:hypothetical protein
MHSITEQTMPGVLHNTVEEENEHERLSNLTLN